MKTCLFFFLSLLNLSVYAQQWEWAKIISYSYNYPIDSHLASDKNGMFYISTNFSINNNACLSKYDSTGNEIWKICLNGVVKINDIVVFSNKIFIIGNFENSITINSTTLNSNGMKDVFMASFSSNGNFIAAKEFGGSQNDFGNGICIDAKGSLYLTGKYSGVAYFGTSNLVCQGLNNMFIAKLDPALNILLLKSAGSKDSTLGSSGTKIKTGKDGSIFILGEFKDIVLDTIHVIGNNYYGSHFLCRLDSLGNTLWVKEVISGTEHINDISLEQDGNIRASGYGGWHGGWIIQRKYDTNGQLLWHKFIGGSCYGDNYRAASMAIEGNNSYVIGTTSRHNCPMPHNKTLLRIKYDSLGNTLFRDSTLEQTSSPNNCIDNTQIIMDSKGDFIICGVLEYGSIVLGNDSISATYKQVFIAKFYGNNLINAVQNNYAIEAINISPNPSSGIFTVDLRNCVDARICVYDVLGNRLLKKDCKNKVSPKIDLSSQPKGIYFMEIVADGERAVKKIVLQ